MRAPHGETLTLPCILCGEEFTAEQQGEGWPQPYGRHIFLSAGGFYGSTVLDSLGQDPGGFTCEFCTDRLFLTFPHLYDAARYFCEVWGFSQGPDPRYYGEGEFTPKGLEAHTQSEGQTG